MVPGGCAYSDPWWIAYNPGMVQATYLPITALLLQVITYPEPGSPRFHGNRVGWIVWEQ